MATLEIYPRADGRFAWKLVADNGSDIVATDGGQGYERRKDATVMALKVIQGGYAGATVVGGSD